MGRRNEILQATGEAADLIQEFPVESRTSFDLIAVIEALDIPVVYRPLDGLWGAAVTIGERSGILVKAGLPRQVQRFTLAHELGHILLGHENQFDEKVGMSQRAAGRSNRPAEEIAADTFASEILAPRVLIQKNANRQGWTRANLQKPDYIYQLSLRLGLSFTATCWALVEDSLLSPGVAEEYTSQDDIVKHTKNIFLPDSVSRDPWADVWHITEHDGGLHMEANKKDIFVVELEERSSSGYLWEFESQNSSIEIVNETTVPGKKYGSPSFRNIGLKFDAPGIYPLTFSHKRPWNGDIIETLEISIDNWGREDEGLPRRIRNTSLNEATK